MADRQGARTGNDSEIYQANRDVIVYNGMQVGDVVELIRSEVSAQFDGLSAKATEVAAERAEKVMNLALEKMIAADPNRLRAAEDPDFQYAIIVAQREYARSGDEDLLEMLSTLLSERSSLDTSEFEKILMNEALGVVGKLTKQQIAGMTARMAFLNLAPSDQGTHWTTYVNQVISRLKLFIDDLPMDALWQEHLVYCSCLTLSDGNVYSAFEIMKRTCPTPFYLPMEESDLDQINSIFPGAAEKSVANYSEFGFGPYPANAEDRKAALQTLGASPEDITKIERLLPNSMTGTQFDEAMTERWDRWPEFRDWWQTRNRPGRLTSVGAALAHASLAGADPSFNLPLSAWINQT